MKCLYQKGPEVLGKAIEKEKAYIMHHKNKAKIFTQKCTLQVSMKVCTFKYAFEEIVQSHHKITFNNREPKQNPPLPKTQGFVGNVQILQNQFVI